MKDKSMEYVYILVALFFIVTKWNIVVKSSWDYYLIVAGFLIIAAAIYRLFFEKNEK